MLRRKFTGSAARQRTALGKAGATKIPGARFRGSVAKNLLVALVFLVCSLNAIFIHRRATISSDHPTAIGGDDDETSFSSREAARAERKLVQFFDETALEQADNSRRPSPIDRLVSLRLTGHMQAGFGNIMIGVFGVIMEAFASNSFPIINNCIILSMFQHPNPSLSFLRYRREEKDGDEGSIKNNNKNASRCQFDEHLLAKYTPNPHHIREQKQVNNQNVVRDMRRGGIMEKYASMLQMDVGDPRLYDVVSSAAAKWMMQRPTPLFRRLVDERRDQILSRCGNGNARRIDRGVQIRTWRDFDYSRRVSYLAIRDDIVSCIRGWLEDALEGVDGIGGPEDAACVYITSDDPVESSFIVEKLKEVVRNKRMTFVSNQPPPQDSWHTKDSFASHKSDFDPRLLSTHDELMDWWIFGEADAAIYTLRSSFGRTARMRRGYAGQKHDYVVGRENVNKPFICNSVQPPDTSTMRWAGSGTLGFKKGARKE